MLDRLTPRAWIVAVAACLVVALLGWAGYRSGEEGPTASAALAVSAEPSPAVTPLEEPRPKVVISATPSPTRTAEPERIPTVTPTPKPKPRPSAAPAVAGLRITIASIGLERRMEGRGLAANGTIDPPKGTVMWFKGFGRVRPGAVGTAVIAGHVTKGGEPDTFHRLSRVRVGDTVQVVEGGKSITYRVTRASAIDKQKVTTDQTVWGPNSSRSRLAIITCDDAFGFRGDGHRKANYVVIAERV